MHIQSVFRAFVLFTFKSLFWGKNATLEPECPGIMVRDSRSGHSNVQQVTFHENFDFLWISLGRAMHIQSVFRVFVLFSLESLQGSR